MVEKWSGDCCEEGPELCCPSREKCECIPNAENCDETETGTETETEPGCICVEIELNYCASSTYAKTICCDPETDPLMCGGVCQPEEFWDAKHSSECQPVSPSLYFTLQKEASKVGLEFVEEDMDGDDGVPDIPGPLH